MTDTTPTTPIVIAPIDWTSKDLLGRIKTRHRKDTWLKAAGIAALGLACAMLGLLVVSLAYNGAQAFTQTHITMDFVITADRVDAADPFKGNYGAIADDAIEALFPEVTGRAEKRELHKILSDGAQYMVREAVVNDPSLIGTTLRLTVPMSDPYDQLAKGLIDRATPEDSRRLKDVQIAQFDRLESAGMISEPFNWGLLTNPNSRFPELAGLAGALLGSFYVLLVCFLIAFPIGIAAAIYLEEFAPKNRWTDIIEVNINNLAAVPSVVFGLLALAVFIGWFGLPRGAPIVGGLALSLITLPTIIIATRSAIKAVPPSIRAAALGVGASKHQVVLSHVLPLAMPGIMTGTIIGMAHALGETAPLLLIGMNASITQIPDSMFEPATGLPTQIYIWADSPERGFLSRTAAAICVLLVFLITMNAIAIYLRRRFEQRW